MEGDELEPVVSPSEILQPEVTMVVTGEPPEAEEEDLDYKEEEESSSEVIETLSLLDVLRVSAIMEDIIDQLSILGYIIPVQYERRQSLSQKASHEAMVPNTPKISTSFLTKEKSSINLVTENKQRGQEITFKKPTKQTTMTLETLKKIQNDRQYFSDVIANAMMEMQESGSFSSLLEALGKERGSKMNFHDVITREEKGRKQIKSLQKQLIDVKRERQMQVQNGNDYIAHLRDQLQEMKAKTNLENLYMKRNTELQIAQTQKKCNRAEELLLEEIEKLRMKTEEENRVHTEIEMFLKNQQQKLEEKLEFWMEKFDKDTEAKQNELNALKAAKASDLAHLQDLAKMIREYEQVIIEDRIEKEKTRKKLEQDDLELRSIVKLQAWWRGTVVRKEIGNFKMPKKDKDDSKDSKGKEKEKRRGKK
ncbi:dynein regulatory complex protein 9 isoform X1 [Arvicanthis niloticus]|uniref:dynein regulatory complex protein 9 isoform X1 n=1 Tax=Arvicanthis niloticus TaxID=61156 RepID=UPI00148603D0|nr:dynein regulatory complex protein 9 isoform X1 [Arvicanthis niloticus]XP_034371580.1 dynein regulatory complex protein 9 isoform X1 [Arvicanthis niloticus]XP_034371581.1 dynein regulatory complex protein 9 isoform X1 [Arvicanthis niloticus]